MADNKFVFRLCGHCKYEIVRKKVPYEGLPVELNHSSLIDHYECSVCSVIFSNIEKFSITGEKSTKK